MKYTISLISIILVVNCALAQTTSKFSSHWILDGTNLSSTNSGNVGIGVSSPISKLHIDGDIRGNQTGGALRLRSSYGYVDIGARNSSWLHIYTDRQRFIFNKPVWLMEGVLSSYSTADLRLQTNGVTRLVVNNSSGFTGIGTNAPEKPLHVNGVIRSYTQNDNYFVDIGTSGSDEVLGLSHSHSGNIIVADDSGHIYVGNGNTKSIDIKSKIISSKGIDAPYFSSYGETLLEWDYSNLYVGNQYVDDITLSSETYVKGDLDAFSLKLKGDNALWYDRDNPSILNVGNNLTDKVQIYTDLKVVNGTIDASGYLLNGRPLDLSGGSNLQNNSIFLENESSGYNASIDVRNNFLQIVTSELGNIISEGFHTYQDQDNQRAIMIGDMSLNKYLDIYANYATIYSDLTTMAGALNVQGTTELNDLKVNNDLEIEGRSIFKGNVGIGLLPSSNYSLSLNGDGNINGTLYSNSVDANSIKTESFIVEKDATLKNNLVVQNEAEIWNKFTVYDNAKISGELELMSLHVNNQSSVSNLDVRYNLDVANNITANKNVQIAEFLTVGEDYYRYTNRRDYKVSVSGKIIAEGLKIKTYENWPDYVFEEDYNLMKLDSLESFIHQNNHLPNIPSSDSVKENGFEVENINALLLEKIEELTLYIIEQNKRIEQLEQKNISSETGGNN